MTEESNPASFSIVGGQTTAANVEFADGVRAVPVYVIAELGGPDELAKLVPNLKNVTFENFMSGFHSVLTKRQVNSFQADFVRNHFGRLF
jgi:hypothetical protein